MQPLWNTTGGTQEWKEEWDEGSQKVQTLGVRQISTRYVTYNMMNIANIVVSYIWKLLREEANNSHHREKFFLFYLYLCEMSKLQEMVKDREACMPQSMGSQTVGHHWETKEQQQQKWNGWWMFTKLTVIIISWCT